MKKSKNIINDKYYNVFKNGSGGSEENIFRIDFVLKDNSIISDAVKIGRVSESNYSGENTVIYEGERIIDSINRNNCKDEIEYILIVNYGYRSWCHQPERSWNRMQIYKINEDFNFNFN